MHGQGMYPQNSFVDMPYSTTEGLKTKAGLSYFLNSSTNIDDIKIRPTWRNASRSPLVRHVP